MTTRRRSPLFWLLVAGLALAASLTAWQVVRAVRDIVYWNIHADEPIQPWMTIGFVAHSYHVPPPMLHEALGLPALVRDRRPLERIAKAQGRPYSVLRARLYYAIIHARPPYPPPRPPAPPLSTPPRSTTPA